MLLGAYWAWTGRPRAVAVGPTLAASAQRVSALPEMQEWIEAARQEGLGVTPSDAFCVSGQPPDAVRISLGGVPERSRLAAALKTLASMIATERVTDITVV